MYAASTKGSLRKQLNQVRGEGELLNPLDGPASCKIDYRLKNRQLASPMSGQLTT
jgi:hypothetical protein